MAELAEGLHQSPNFASIAEAATASWLAHRASTPSSRQGTKAQTPVPIPGGQSKSASLAPESASASASASASSAIPTPTPPPASAPVRLPSSSTSAYLLSTKPPVETPVPVPVFPGSAPSAPAIAIPAPPSATGTSPGISSSYTSSLIQENGESTAHTEIRSDITAWESALQTLPDEFKGRELPTHPLTEVLHKQPTKRPVEWNQFRQQGGFVPRTAHDFASLMIYLCGQVNPNPCRNCQLRNGPFSRCIVSPPQVLGVSFLRHACANCTYQNQYKRCTNEPITEAEKVRSDLLRTVVRPRHSVPKPTTAKRPKAPSRHKVLRDPKFEQREQIRQHEAEKGLQESYLHPAIRAAGHDSEQQKTGNNRPTLPEAPSVQLPMGQPPNLTFDQKLRHAREMTPQLRRRMMAEATQWQAALMTVEAEEPTPTPIPMPMPMPVPTPVPAPAPAPAPYQSASNQKRQRMDSYTFTTTTPHEFALSQPRSDRGTLGYVEPLGPPAGLAIAQDRLRVPRQPQTPSQPPSSAPARYAPTSFTQVPATHSRHYEEDTTMEDESEEEEESMGFREAGITYGWSDNEDSLREIKAPRD
ncbi:hypothetical protein GGR57DRAFT_290045 [Xylariaceae sp. FL1272]|nr:hypothetical protein GGR57DRAFT_290045 [Xylariaceae sp. FL1272]